MSAYSSAHVSPPGRARGAQAGAGHPGLAGAPFNAGPAGNASGASGALARGRAETSRVPLVVGLSVVALSVVVAIIVLTSASAPAQLFPWLVLPLVQSGSWALSLVGYLLTPLAVILAYGWDVAWQRQARADNRNVVLHPGDTRLLKWLMIAGIILGVWHVLNLAVPLAEAWGVA